MSEIGVKLRDLAFQRDPGDYQDVLDYLGILQERERKKEPLGSDDHEAMDIAQAYLQEVEEPSEKGVIDRLMSCIERKDVKGAKEILHDLSERIIDGSGLDPEQEQAKEIAKKFVFQIQKLGKPSSLKGRRNETFLA